MSRLLIEPVTPDEPGYIALKAESIALNFNMLRRLEENWLRGENRFNAPGEKLLGAFLNGKLVGVCGLNRDPFSQQPRAGRIRHLYVSEKCRGLGIGKQLLTVVMADASIWFDFLNTHSPDSAYGFYNRAGFTLVSDEPRVTHRLFCAV
ncbi:MULTISPECIES: GNAT family N-acetyltransferase [Enterobacter]|uniref:GNAT family N-acetyltransferase n=1 Tax=Enterobacter TaxID=547 RepID=UPI00073C4954|nr:MULTISPECIES: GNAT family N-acetyltransferase [Enterobacter]EKS6931047.1 GNAT family N-acetyltransferase [Enterobacter bugandensis]EKV5174209.1 GNAT family N-acetyltransferase [Enterobacter bugandensis]KSX63557.1 GCN5 family acetyltransferase [Enterobacter sp. 50588862]MDX7475545.1 GNAT family N-acetyltransferase [Enterobacter bugandensis]HDR2821383.1 GNAT family N-acetyltransferase [Enterobacter bugandensis]